MTFREFLEQDAKVRIVDVWGYTACGMLIGLPLGAVLLRLLQG